MINDRSRAVTVEDLIRMYNLEGLKTDRKRITTIRNTLERQYNIIKDFIYFIAPYKNQADMITVWFYDGVPTIEVDNTLSNLYYDRNTGDIYSFNNNAWTLLEDTNLAKSLALANGEPDTSDNKRNVFYSIPITPYEIGDVWINDNVIMRCRCARSAGEYKDTDWVTQENYTSDLILKDTKAILDQFIETVEADYVTKVILETTKDSILAQVETTITDVNNNIESLSSELELQAGQIALKLNASRFTTSAIIGLINNRDGTSSAKIRADNIDLNGTNINMTADNITLSSDFLDINKYGRMDLTDPNDGSNAAGIYIKYASAYETRLNCLGLLYYDYLNNQKSQFGFSTWIIANKNNNRETWGNEEKIQVKNGSSYTDYTYSGQVISSDERIKDNITNIEEQTSLSIIKELKPVQYTYKNINNIYHRGLLAQDVKQVLKNNGIEKQIYKYDQVNDIYSINYIELIPDLINCIKYQEKEIDKLKQRLEKLDGGK